MVPACRSMHFLTAVNVPQAMVGFCVTKLRNSLILANHLNVNMANADSRAWGKPTVSATVATPERTVIKVNLHTRSVSTFREYYGKCYCA